VTDNVRLAAMMCVGNEKGRYVKEVLANLARYVDAIVVLDDGSTDGTGQLCRGADKVVYHRHETSLFYGQESALRSKLWHKTMALGPRWVLAIDADERFEERMAEEIDILIQQDEFDVVEFRLFDFWGGTTHYRVDGPWDPWTKSVRMLFRVDPDGQYTWPVQPFHCPRLPLEARTTPRVFQCDIRVKHFGWANRADIRRKYDRYKQFDGSDQLKSVLDKDDTVRLERWVNSKPIPF